MLNSSRKSKPSRRNGKGEGLARRDGKGEGLARRDGKGEGLALLRRTSSRQPDTSSYPHPAFPGPCPPTVEVVAKAKAALISIVRDSSQYKRVIGSISIRPKENRKFTLYSVDKAGTPTIGEGITAYSLLVHEGVWTDLLDRIYADLGNLGTNRGIVSVDRNQDTASLVLLWGNIALIDL